MQTLYDRMAIKLVQEIGDLVCEGCGPTADCGVKPEECYRIIEARKVLEKYVEKTTPAM